MSHNIPCFSALTNRLREIMKYERETYVIFGVFSLKLKSREICPMFITEAKSLFKKAKALGRIWCLEVNGSGKGCGLIGADDKIKIWRDLPKDNVRSAPQRF